MLNSICIKYGSNDNYKELIIDNSPLTIFVGPNNSGKSLILREIRSGLNGFFLDNKILSSINIDPPSLEVALQF